MNTIIPYQATIESSIEFLGYDFIYQVQLVNENKIEVDFYTCTLVYVIDRYYNNLSIYFEINGKKYFVNVLAKIQDPNFFDDIEKLRSELTAQESIKYEIIKYGKFITNYCRAILAGEFSFINEYESFVRELKKLRKMVKEMDDSNPIKQKFNRGDKTWYTDLKTQLQSLNNE